MSSTRRTLPDRHEEVNFICTRLRRRRPSAPRHGLRRKLVVLPITLRQGCVLPTARSDQDRPVQTLATSLERGGDLYILPFFKQYRAQLGTWSKLRGSALFSSGSCGPSKIHLVQMLSPLGPNPTLTSGRGPSGPSWTVVFSPQLKPPWTKWTKLDHGLSNSFRFSVAFGPSGPSWTK